MPFKHNDVDELKANKRRKDNAKIIYAIGVFSSLCISVPLCVLIGFFIGRFLDKVFSTSPLFLIIFLVLGVIAAYTTLFKSFKK